MTNRWFAFRAHNAETIFGYGTEAEAEQYAARLNADREVGHCRATVVADADLIAALDDDGAAGGSRGVALAAELAELDD